MKVIASETESLEHQPRLTGVQRVVSGLNEAIFRELQASGVDFVPVHTWATRKRPVRPWADFLEASAFMEQAPVRPEEADALLFLDISHVNFPLLASRHLRHVPKVFFIHDTLPITHPDWFPENAHRSYRLFLRQVLAVADHVICATHHEKANIHALGWDSNAEIHVVPLGSFRAPVPEAPLARESLSILYVSTVEPRKGHDLVIDTLERLESSGVDVSVTLVGRSGWTVQHGWDVEAIIRRIRGHRLFGSRLHWWENADDATVKALGARCTHAVLPPIDEGFGLFLEESLALNLKVVASDIPVFRERTWPNVTLAARNAESFADALLVSHGQEWTPLSDPRLRQLRDTAADLASLMTALIGAR